MSRLIETLHAGRTSGNVRQDSSLAPLHASGATIGAVPPPRRGLRPGWHSGQTVRPPHFLHTRPSRYSASLHSRSHTDPIGSPIAHAKNPLPNRTAGRQFIALDHETLQCYEQIWNRIAQSIDLSEPRAIAITSALAREGKTSVAIGLAFAAALAHHQVLLIDANPSCQGATERLGAPPIHGLCEVLAEGLHPSEAIRTVAPAGFDLLSPGRPSTRATELFASRRMNVLLWDLKQAYDLIVVDCAHFSEQSASQYTVGFDAVYLCVRMFKTGQKAIDRAIDQMQHGYIPIAGCVLTHSEPAADVVAALPPVDPPDEAVAAVAPADPLYEAVESAAVIEPLGNGNTEDDTQESPREPVAIADLPDPEPVAEQGGEFDPFGLSTAPWDPAVTSPDLAFLEEAASTLEQDLAATIDALCREPDPESDVEQAEEDHTEFADLAAMLELETAIESAAAFEQEDALESVDADERNIALDSAADTERPPESLPSIDLDPALALYDFLLESDDQASDPDITQPLELCSSTVTASLMQLDATFSASVHLCYEDSGPVAEFCSDSAAPSSGFQSPEAALDSIWPALECWELESDAAPALEAGFGIALLCDETAEPMDSTDRCIGLDEFRLHREELATETLRTLETLRPFDASFEPLLPDALSCEPCTSVGADRPAAHDTITPDPAELVSGAESPTAVVTAEIERFAGARANLRSRSFRISPPSRGLVQSGARDMEQVEGQTAPWAADVLAIGGLLLIAASILYVAADALLCF